MQTLASQRSGGHALPHKTVLDLLVVCGGDLERHQTRALQRIQLVAQKTERTANRRGIWVLVMSRSYVQSAVAYRLTQEITPAPWCQGVRIVVEDERDPTLTARAILDFHRLQFPCLDENERAARILVLGSEREMTILGTCPGEEDL